MFSLTPTRDLPAWTQQGIIRYSLSEDSCHSSVITPLVTHHCTGEKFDIRSANTQNDARLDVSARGVWSAMDKTFLDIRVFNSRAPTNISKPLKSVLIHHEKEKKRAYNARVLEVEKCSFSPIVFSTTGIMGNEACKFYRKLAEKLSGKSRQSYPDSIRYIRQRLSFCLLKTTIVSLRGFKGKKPTEYNTSLDINLLYM